MLHFTAGFALALRDISSFGCNVVYEETLGEKPAQDERDIEMNNLGKFLVNAKRNTYAAQKGKVPSSRKYSKDLAFEENDYYYLDSYFGEKDFSGEEIVYFKELPIWSMNYYGKMIKENIPEGFIKTLREALQKVSENKPFRGPEEYIRGNINIDAQMKEILIFSTERKVFFTRMKKYIDYTFMEVV